MTRLHARARLKKRADHICQRCGFAAMLVCVIIISLVMVAVALEMYNTSGAAQVDLSRPGLALCRSRLALAKKLKKVSRRKGRLIKKLSKILKMYTTNTPNVRLHRPVLVARRYQIVQFKSLMNVHREQHQAERLQTSERTAQS